MKGNRLKDEIAQLSLSDPPNLQSEISNIQFKRRRGWDSNPRWPQGPQRFSRPPRSSTPAPLRELPPDYTIAGSMASSALRGSVIQVPIL